MMQFNESYYRIVLWLDTNADLGQCLINGVTSQVQLSAVDFTGYACQELAYLCPRRLPAVRALQLDQRREAFQPQPCVLYLREKS